VKRGFKGDRGAKNIAKTKKSEQEEEEGYEVVSAEISFAKTGAG